jgi:hypothetical protein
MPLALPEDSNSPTHRNWISAQRAEATLRGVRDHTDQHTMRTLGDRKSRGRCIGDFRHQLGKGRQIGAKVFAKPDALVDLDIPGGQAALKRAFAPAGGTRVGGWLKRNPE